MKVVNSMPTFLINCNYSLVQTSWSRNISYALRCIKPMCYLNLTPQ